MKRNTRLFTLILALGVIGIMYIRFAPPLTNVTNGTSRDWQRNPPIPDSTWVKKLADTLNDGSNMLIKVKYLEDTSLPTNLYVFHDSDYATLFRDDGNFPDSIASDFIYTASYKQADITGFVNDMNSYETAIANKGSYVDFKGHVGMEVDADLPTFDETSFDNNAWVFLDRMLLNAEYCNDNVKKEYSLFITDLSVVEDPNRTYKIYDINHPTPGSPSGNPLGVWTFGAMMANMANPLVTGIDPNDFIKEWLKHWTAPQTVNGQTIAARMDVITFLIRPWLRKAKNNPTLVVDETNWEGIMSDLSNTEMTALLVNAPFKLTAIVNRLDLHGTLAYSGALTTAGETRFIFTLINPSSYTYKSFTNQPGQVPVQPDQDFTSPIFADWEGMNVIFEYGNVQKNKCELQAFAQQWYNLTALGNFPTVDHEPHAAYNDALEDITNTVTSANSHIGKPNNSAINRIRTNERIFFVPNRSGPTWQAADWEFRQFEIDPYTSHLVQVPLSNTPVNEANFVTGGGLVETNFMNGAAQTTTGTGGTIHTVNAFLDWAYSSSPILNSIKHGLHNIPNTFPGTSIPFLAGAGKVDGEKVHHWNFYWYNDLNNYKISTTLNPAFRKAEVRHQLSLNTCQGCHNGETKGVFTMVRPLNYGEPAKYWGAAATIPDNVVRFIDNRIGSGGSAKLVTTNDGDTYESSTSSYVPNNSYPSGATYLQNVAAFITGRSYTGASGTFDDDKLGTESQGADNTTDGLFYVNSPVNDASNGKVNPPVFPFAQEKFGYNDLMMRQNRMCRLLAFDCSPGGDVRAMFVDINTMGPTVD